MTVTKQISIEELNALGPEEFVTKVGWVFEHAPWVAERAWPARPFQNLDGLHRAMIHQVSTASEQEQLALLRAHPDLGARARMTDASSAEQSGAGLDRLSPEEFLHLHALNSRYREAKGFPFLFAVKGSTKHDILRALERRVEENQQNEIREALRQVYQIARFRLEDIIL